MGMPASLSIICISIRAEKLQSQSSLVAPDPPQGCSAQDETGCEETDPAQEGTEHHLVHGFLIACDSHCSRRTANKSFLCYTTPFWAGWWLSWEAWLRGSLDLLQYMRKRHPGTVRFFTFCCVLSPVSVPHLPQPHGTSRAPRLWVQIWREGAKGLEITSPSHIFKS